MGRGIVFWLDLFSGEFSFEYDILGELRIYWSIFEVEGLGWRGCMRL